jgi:hypothetical protein
MRIIQTEQLHGTRALITSPCTVRCNYHLGTDLAKQVDEIRFTRRYLDMASTMRALLNAGLAAAAAAAGVLDGEDEG